MFFVVKNLSGSFELHKDEVDNVQKNQVYVFQNEFYRFETYKEAETHRIGEIKKQIKRRRGEIKHLNSLIRG